MRVEDLVVYQRLCQLHLQTCELARGWPAEERYELGSQIRRSSNSSPANLAKKHSDRHVRNKIEGIHRARGEALGTIRHLHIAKLETYVSEEVYTHLRAQYLECVRMLNGMERTLERHISPTDQRWPDASNHTIARRVQT